MGQGSEDGHIHRCADVFVIHIRHDQRDLFAGGDPNHVIEVAADLAGGADMRRNFPAFRLWIIIHKKTELDLPCDLQFLFQQREKLLRDLAPLVRAAV